MKRWTCPTCHGGVLAPAKPLMDDVRRYCLPCSASTGKLVRRACGSRERVKAERRDARAERVKADRDRAVARELARHTVGGLDVRAVVRRVWSALAPELRAFTAARMLAGKSMPSAVPPEVRIRRVALHHNFWRITTGSVLQLTFRRDAGPADVWGVILRGLTCRATGHLRDVAYNVAIARVARRLCGVTIPTCDGDLPVKVLEEKLAQKFARVGEGGDGAKADG